MCLWRNFSCFVYSFLLHFVLACCLLYDLKLDFNPRQLRAGGSFKVLFQGMEGDGKHEKYTGRRVKPQLCRIWESGSGKQDPLLSENFHNCKVRFRMPSVGSVNGMFRTRIYLKPLAQSKDSAMIVLKLFFFLFSSSFLLFCQNIYVFK